MRIDRPEDHDLDQAFAHLREQDRRRTPSAHDLIARAKASIEDDASNIALRAAESGDLDRTKGRGWGRWGVPGLSVALAAAVATVLLVDRDSLADQEFDEVLASYVDTRVSLRSPSDALLRLPGDELIRTVPRVGGLRPASRDTESPS